MKFCKLVHCDDSLMLPMCLADEISALLAPDYVVVPIVPTFS